MLLLICCTASNYLETEISDISDMPTFSTQAKPEDIITPISYTVTRTINSEIPEFEFKLEGARVEKTYLSSSQSDYYYSQADTEISTLTVSSKDGSFKQEFTNLSTCTSSSESDMYGLSFDDWNFDGYLDVSLWQYIGGSMGNAPTYYWLWDNDVGMFVANTELGEISESSTVYRDVANKQVKSFTNFGCGGYGEGYYEYINGNYVTVKLKEQLYEPVKGDETQYHYHIIIQELVDGDLKITEDCYEDIQK